MKRKKKEKKNKGLTLDGRLLGIVQVWVKKSQSLTLDRKDKVKHYIRIKAHNTIVLRFWGKSGVKGLICVRLMSYNHIELHSLNIIITITIYEQIYITQTIKVRKINNYLYLWVTQPYA